MYTSAWTVTHDEKYWHEPFAFKPERWIDPDCKDVKEASQPFSLGPRGCLGRKYVFPTFLLYHQSYPLPVLSPFSFVLF